MSDLPASSNANANAMLRSVPPHAPRPSREWLAGRVATFLSHFYQPEGPDPVLEAMMEDWVEVLRDLPQRSIELAVWERLRSSDRRRPMAGEIRAAARKFINYPSPQKPEGRDPLIRLVTPERQAEIAEEVGGVCSTVFRTPRQSAADQIVRVTMAVFGIDRREFYSPRRPAEYVAARFAASYLIKRHTSLSLPQIGAAVGKDHTSVLHQIARAVEMYDGDEDFKARVDEIERRLAE